MDAGVIDISHYLEERKQWIDNALTEIIAKMHQWPPLLREAVSYSLLAGGKRIRPILALASFESLGATAKTALPVVCSLECIHTYSLIHDDLPAMDDDDFRRGLSTNHKKFGEGVAILAGDALLTAAFSLISDPLWEPTFPSQIRLAALHELAVGAGGAGMVGGQLLDICSEGNAINRETLQYIHSHKTGALIQASIRMGAILGEANDAELLALTLFGEKVGLAFQIADDILDVEGSQKVLGKNTKRDRENKKNTYPSLFGLDRSKVLAQTLVEEALQVLQGLDHRAEPLRKIALFIIERKR